MPTMSSTILDRGPLASDQADERSRAERLFLDNLPLVDSVITAIGIRRLRPGDREDFRSQAMLKLIDHDYKVLRQFAGRSSLRTYLTIVFERVLLDERTRVWGKWRPSCQAKRLGKSAVRLEQLLTRDGLTRAEALQVMQSEGGDGQSAARLDEVADRLPGRTPRRVEQEDALLDVPDAQPLPDAQAADVDRRRHIGRVRAALGRAFRVLGPEDQLIIRLRFTDQLSVVEISRLLATDQKLMYRRISRILAQLRTLVQAEGVTDEIVRELGGGYWSDLPERERRTAPRETARRVRQ